jgi:hypothetical protein
MKKLRVPSLQHMVRNWRNDPDLIKRSLVTLARNPPIFNYNPLFGAVQDLLILKVPYKDVEEGIRRIKREGVRNNFLGVLPLIRQHFEGISPDYYQTIDKRLYPIGRGLSVPFEPPMVYGVEGHLTLPWLSFWRRYPLAKERLSLFVTIIDEILMQDPDLENASFRILDFSCPSPTEPRELKIIEARDIERVDDGTKKAMLDVFAEGYFRAVEALKDAPPPAEDDAGDEEEATDQPPLF